MGAMFEASPSGFHLGGLSEREQVILSTPGTSTLLAR